MSTAYPPLPPTSTSLNTQHPIAPLPEDTFDEGWFLSDASQFPVFSYPQMATSSDATFIASTSHVPEVYSVEDIDQGHGKIDPLPGMPLVTDSGMSMSMTNFQTPCNFFYDTNALATLGATSYEEPAQFTFQDPFPTNTAPVQAEHHEIQDTHQDLTMKVPHSASGMVQSQSNQHHVMSRIARAELEALSVHICRNNPQSACSGLGDKCLEALCRFIEKYTQVLRDAKFLQCVFGNVTRTSTAGKFNFGRVLRADTDICKPTARHADVDPKTLLPGSESSLSGASALPSDLPVVTAPLLTGSDIPLTRKRPLPVRGGREDRAKRPRLEPHACSPDGHGEHGEGRETRADGSQSTCCKEKPADQVDLRCRICIVLGISDRRFSRKDSLKRHVWIVHAMLRELLDPKYEGLKILEPHRLDNEEDLMPLILFCIDVQAKMRRRGNVKIDPEHDFMRIFSLADDEALVLKTL